MKKAFTLVEMVIVIIIISLLLWVLSFLSWSYISKLNVQNEIESLEWDFFYLQSMSLSQPKIWNIDNIKYIWVKLSPSKDYIKNLAFTGDDFSKSKLVKLIAFSYIRLWSWFEVFSGSNLEKTINNDIIFLYKPYSMWAILVEDNWWAYNLLTWNYTIKFLVNSIYQTKTCFKINLESWRLYKTDCHR